MITLKPGMIWRKYFSLLSILVLLVQPVVSAEPVVITEAPFYIAPAAKIEPIVPLPEASFAPIAAPEPVVAAPPKPVGYPSKWADPPIDTVVDDWGNYNRECVSYTAWKVASTGRHMPAWWSHAQGWLAKAAESGIPTGSQPRVGSVGISMGGEYGHAIYVEAVYGNGTILLSQYNAIPGQFSTDVQSAANYTYIYF